MAKRKLPLKDSPEGQALIKAYSNAPNEQLELWAKQYGYANRMCFMMAMARTMGVKRSSPTPLAPEILEEGEPEPIIKVIPVKLKSYRPVKRGKGDPETQVLLLGDHHAGLITPTYSPEVYKQRLGELFNSTLTITKLHRNMYPVNDLVIFALGDMVHGENPRQGAKIGSVACGASDQVYDLALPELVNLLNSLKQEFKTIKLYGVPGNHGRYSLEAPETSNWDIMLYKALANTKLPAGIEIYPPVDFCQLVDIQGFRFFIFHGDQIRMSQGIPYFAQRRKVMSWYVTFRGFAYACSGHVHEEDLFRVSSETKLFVNGPLVTDDPFALKVMATSSIPTQWTFGVHSRIGLTWSYSLIADYDFLPQRSKP